MAHNGTISLTTLEKYLKDFKARSRWTTFNGALQLLQISRC